VAAKTPHWLCCQQPCFVGVKSVSTGCPEIIDVHILLEIIKTLGVEVLFENETVRLDTTQLTPRPLPNGSVAQIRASIYLAGVLLTQFGEVTIGLPGGCPLNRQVDFHLDAFQRMGAKVWLEGEIIRAVCPSGKLHGAVIELDPRWRSVGTTCQCHARRISG
jgi:UDP-N-acetylglucosamine 1-carboxyvinyltransferase